MIMLSQGIRRGLRLGAGAAALVLLWQPLQASAQTLKEAETNAEAHRRALLFCWRFNQGWQQHADPETGLIPRNLGRDQYWNAKDAAADNYPFMVLSAWFTDRELFNGPLREILYTEQRLCNRIDRLPAAWHFGRNDFLRPEPDLDRLIFGASEYAKDGLLPLTEWLGPSPWSQRMVGLMEDTWKHAATESPVGVLPSTSREVGGELMQVFSRLYWMTREDAYQERAFRLAEYFFEHDVLTEGDELRLDDHGCEVIGGLSEVYYLASRRAPAKREAWQPAMHAVLDLVREIGRDPYGLLYENVNPNTGRALSKERTDNWGYNYNAFAVVAELDNIERYRAALDHVLKNLNMAKDYPWEGDKADGIADALEGGLNLINRRPVPAAVEWADYTAERLLATQRDTGVIEGWHGDGNAARTALMFALWKSQGMRLEPWRADLRLGAVTDAEGAAHVFIGADWPWEGKLRFDIPRHQEHLGLPTDYPRLNQFPEWFTVGKTGVYRITVESGPDLPEKLSGNALRRGISVKVHPDKPVKLIVTPPAG